MSKIDNDKYYTPDDIVKHCVDTTFGIIGLKNITEIIEPSAGNGAFLKHLPIWTQAYDIEPEGNGIYKQDFLTLDRKYYEGRLIIGNPPFGKSNSLSIKFFNKACELGDYISFIQPISQLDNNLQMYKFDLIYSEDLRVRKYSDRDLHCCLNIWRVPENGKLNEKPNFTLKDITIKEWRRGGAYKYPESFHFSMCNWGNGSLGKVLEYHGQYAQSVYITVNKPEYYDKVKELLEFNTIREYVKSISMKRISVMRLYKYFSDNIEGIQ